MLWYVPYVGLNQPASRMPLILGAVFSALLLSVIGVLVLLALTVVLGRDLFFSRKLRGAVIKLLLPMMSGVGKVCGVPKDQVRRSFIEINNQLVLAQHYRTTPDKLLLLMPHCLQFHECQFRITAARALQTLRQVPHQGAGGALGEIRSGGWPWPLAAPWPGASSSTAGPG